LRRAALARRDALDAGTRAAAAEAIAARPLAFAVRPGDVVAGYAPIRSEIDPVPLLRRCAEVGALIALPRVLRRAAALAFLAWRPGDPLTRGHFGIGEPSPDAQALDPDIVFVPLAAFDRAGHRIGYGTGYYDRTLQALRARRAVLTVGIGFSAQEVDAVPAAGHDETVDLVLTERDVIDPRRP
jgi:5-formyltetrahydrofolate cyclo-ligase